MLRLATALRPGPLAVSSSDTWSRVGTATRSSWWPWLADVARIDRLGIESAYCRASGLWVNMPRQSEGARTDGRIEREDRGEGGPGGSGTLPSLPDRTDALDGQRRLRARQQRRLLLLLRHGRERVPYPLRHTGHPEEPGHRARRRDPVPVLQTFDLPRHRQCGPACRPPGP